VRRDRGIRVNAVEARAIAAYLDMYATVLAWYITACALHLSKIESRNCVRGRWVPSPRN